MLTLLAYSMVVVFMALIMTKRLSAMVALILVPIAFGAIGGFGPELGPMMLDGVKKLAPTGVMLMFAILYFGVMIDAGLFDPVVRCILKMVGGDPVKIIIGTFMLAVLVSLDGDGSTTYMITCAAMLPLYKRLGISRLVLACVIMMAGGLMNILPWGGPTARAASALGVDVGALFVPMILPMIVTGMWGLFVAFLLGRRERDRLGSIALMSAGTAPPVHSVTSVHSGTSVDSGPAGHDMQEPGAGDPQIARPNLLWFNFLLTIGLMALLILGIFPLPALFIVASAIALMFNYPTLHEQKERIAAHAANVVPVVSLIFAAGIFVGILSGTKMVDAIANSVIGAVPDWMGPYMAVVTGVLSIPFTFFISNDAFYFGILPILAKAAAVYGISAAEIGRASLIGQQVHLLSPLVASTYLLVGLAEVEFGDHQRYTLLWALSAAAVMMLATVAFGVIPVIGQAA
ncbi:CitMHS family transporter [Cupriavidus consociatus]|uniref:CitMHS family transporter n=1 Tax=Cupriavidus consociatus TaxID=2821357 RepID=UPI001AE3E6A4|nr:MULTISPECIES: CitMHS family transporter [unclassified Cupriavidus]MBP0619454.1 CitMHS family transporter [Cupriavidus sp. LEh25]MDK2656102.1 CitMHS family transporter [Cupriavidus sp. LEh21]